MFNETLFRSRVFPLISIGSVRSNVIFPGFNPRSLSALRSFGNFQPLHFSHTADHRSEDLPLRGIVDLFSCRFPDNTRVLSLGKNQTEMRLLTAQSIEGVHKEHVETTATHFFPKQTELWALEELSPGVHLAIDPDNAPATVTGEIAARSLLGLETVIVLLTRATHSTINSNPDLRTLRRERTSD